MQDKKKCNNCNGSGCNQCNQGYKGFCTSRSTTFRQWAAQCQGPYCKDRASKPEGFIRRTIDGLDNALESAIYPEDADGISGGLQGGVGVQ